MEKRRLKSTVIAKDRKPRQAKPRPQTLLLGYPDGRSMEAKRWRDLYLGLLSDLGGNTNASVAQDQLARRASALAVMCEVAEAQLARGDPFDTAHYLTAANAQRRILVSLGLKRQARDVTPTLHTYLDEKAERTAKREANN